MGIWGFGRDCHLWLATCVAAALFCAQILIPLHDVGQIHAHDHEHDHHDGQPAEAPCAIFQMDLRYLGVGGAPEAQCMAAGWAIQAGRVGAERSVTPIDLARAYDGRAPPLP